MRTDSLTWKTMILMYRLIRRVKYMGYNKRYDGEFCISPRRTKQICIRLTYEELDILNKLFPGKNNSYAIRTLIHKSKK